MGERCGVVVPLRLWPEQALAVGCSLGVGALAALGFLRDPNLLHPLVMGTPAAPAPGPHPGPSPPALSTLGLSPVCFQCCEGRQQVWGCFQTRVNCGWSHTVLHALSLP